PDSVQVIDSLYQSAWSKGLQSTVAFQEVQSSGVSWLLPGVTGAQRLGILQVRAGVRGFAGSVAPSRLSPHW
ncbi:hypothetical protein KUCAC02_028212, partial [Chaenocephalus aceratus]